MKPEGDGGQGCWKEALERRFGGRERVRLLRNEYSMQREGPKQSSGMEM